jgi:hypothetical protein
MSCAALIGLLVAARVGAADKNKPIPSEPAWYVKYTSGSLGLKKNQWLAGIFRETAHQHEEKTAIVQISRDQLRSISFDPTAEKDSGTMQRMSRSGCAYARTRMPGDDSAPAPEVFLAKPASPGRLSRAAERLDARHPVRITWSDDGVEKELFVTVNQCEYASFVANLRRLAGQRWGGIAHEFPR